MTDTANHGLSVTNWGSWASASLVTRYDRREVARGEFLLCRVLRYRHNTTLFQWRGVSGEGRVLGTIAGTVSGWAATDTEPPQKPRVHGRRALLRPTVPSNRIADTSRGAFNSRVRLPNRRKLTACKLP
jgi:hypothetical protein